MLQCTVAVNIYMSVCFVWITLIDSTNGSLVLSSSTPEPVEGSTVSLTCSYTDVTPLPQTTTWYRNGDRIGTISYTGCLGDFDLTNYTVTCLSSDEYTLTITSVQIDLHNTTWYCQRGNLNSNTVILRIKVPVKSLAFNNSGSTILTLRESDSQSISCTTSNSRPRANVTWYTNDRESLAKVYLQDVDTSYSTDTNFLSTISTLRVTFNRTFNEWKLVCEAENIQGYTAVSKSLSLNITYSTNEPIIQCTDNGVYKVVHNTEGRLTCSVDGGNPAGTLHWNCTGDTTDDRGPNNNVTQSIVWTATQNQYCTCTATNYVGDRSTSVKTVLLYHPVIDELQDKAEFEGDSVTLQCVVLQANPPVSVIGWTSNKHNISGSTLLMSNISRTDDGTYTCTANTTMEPSCKDVVHGSTSRSLHLEVLYQPKLNIPHGQSLTVNEGDRFSYICPVEHGNPPSTNITWRRSTDTSTWRSTELLIDNVTRYDDAVYTCYASNVMVNSNGITRIGHVSADIRLIVQFKTNVTDFYVRGHRHNIRVTVMENASLVFECHLQGNPISRVRIYEAATLVNISTANQMLYYTDTMCSGRTVTYSCSGNNSLSNSSSTLKIELVVNCTPRRDMNVDELVTAGAINKTVTLSYTTLAYPLPSFTWYRNGSTIDSTDPRFIVSSTDLQTNLTIENVEESDFGEYELRVANDNGFIDEYFDFKPQGVPEVPTHLKQNNISTTDSTISLSWKSGFNNGLEQSFIIMYKQHTGHTWMDVSVPDKGRTGTNQHHNIFGLSSDTYYDIVLFAVNAIGSSKNNVTLTCRTNKANIIQNPESSAELIGGIVGVVVGLVLAAVIIVVVVLFRRRFVKYKRSESSTDQPVTYENLKMEQLPNTPLDYQGDTSNNETPGTNVDTCNTYEGLSREDNEKESEYTQLGNTNHDDAIKTYENLKIQLSSCQPSSG